MKIAIPLALMLLAGLCACGKSQSGLYAERSIPILAPAASAATPPRFVGRWAASTAECATPWVFEARSLREAGLTCEFDRVDESSAGYSVATVCRMPKGPLPARLSIVLPETARVSNLTVSGGPFSDAVALQRCGA